MSTLQKSLPILLCLCLVAGCYEDIAEVTLNPDGSGTVKQKLVVSERLLVSEGGSNDNAPPATKEKVLEEIMMEFALLTDLSQAGKYYLEALPIYKDIENRLGEANTLISLGNLVSFSGGKFEETR